MKFLVALYTFMLIAVVAVSSARGVPDRTWDRLAQCESSGRWSLDAYHDGGLQFHPQTWSAYRLPRWHPPFAWQASRRQQINVAERVLRDQGWNAWPHCARRLGLL